jgi:MarR family transcriptional regulator, organic hydroperoxide resistance regulator
VAIAKTDRDEAVREQFHASWTEFAAAVRRARSRAANRPDAKLTPAQFHLLSALEGGRALTVGELAAAAGVSSPTATRMLDALEREEMVRRKPSVEDRRRISVEMTAAGKRAMATGRRRLDAARERIYEELLPAEREQAARLLTRLADALEQI